MAEVQLVQGPALISRVLTLAMAVACGLAVANIYYNQPMLAVIERSFHGGTAAGMIPTATQLGYAAGLFALVPLGDLVERRRLIVVQFLALAVALTGAAVAPTAVSLVVASVVVGICSSVAQQIVPLASLLAPPARRGATVGVVMSGLLCGVLLSRTLAGFVATYLGWRAMFWFGVPLAVLTAGLMASVLPHSQPAQASLGYGGLLKSLGWLWCREPALRRATLSQAALFGSFSTFWTILPLHLEAPAFHLGADVAGLFGIVGTVGVFAAPLAGRLADRRGPHLVIGLGAAVTFASWLVFGLWGSLAGLVCGVILLDFGVQSSLVSNQHVVYALHPEARGRLNTVFMTGVFLGGSSGSAGAMIAWKTSGWPLVCGFGATLGIIALALQARQVRAPAP